MTGVRLRSRLRQWPPVKSAVLLDRYVDLKTGNAVGYNATPQGWPSGWQPSLDSAAREPLGWSAAARALGQAAGYY